MDKRWLPLLLLILLVLAACSPATSTPTAVPTPRPTATPVPSPTPTPTAAPSPTPTPQPLARLDILWPDAVSALRPVTVAVSLALPPGQTVTPTVRATVLDGGGEPVWVGRLWPQGGGRYAARQTLQLPLRPAAGDWRLKVYVQTTLPVTGTQEMAFRPLPLAFRPLTDTLPSGATLAVPQAFTEVLAEGDDWAGVRVWRYAAGEVGLWWAPGPTEPLLLNNAVVMLEATQGDANPPRVLRVEETEWRGHPAFLFHERWPGAEGGPAEAWVVQGGDYWLYVLRMRAVGGQEIPALMRLVGETFTLR